MKSTEDYLDSLLAGAVKKDKDRAAGVSDGSGLMSLSSDNSSFDGPDAYVNAHEPEKEHAPKTSHTRTASHKSSEDALDRLLRQAMGQEEPVADEVEASEEPLMEESVTEEQADEYSDFVEESAGEPAVEETIPEETVVEDSFAEEPVIEEPVMEEPIPDTPANEPVIDEPGSDESKEETSGALFGDSSKMMSLDEIAAIIASAGDGLIDEDGPANAFDEPVDNIPSLDDDDELLEKNLPEEPVIEEPIIEETVVDEPVIEEAFEDEPVIEESLIEESVADESVTEEPVIEEPDIDDAGTDVPSDEFGGVDGDLSLEELMPDRYDGEGTSEPEIFEGDVLSHGMPQADESVVPEEDTETISGIEILDDNGVPINEEPAVEEAVPEETADEQSAEEAVPEEAVDPGRAMSQDDIASLLDSMQLDDQDKDDIETLEDNVVTVTDDENNEVDIDVSSRMTEDISEDISFDDVEKEMEEIKNASPDMTDEEADSRADDLMSMLLDEGDGEKGDDQVSGSEDKAGEAEGIDKENFGGIADQLDDMSDASEEDIEKLLAAAEKVDDKPAANLDGDVTDIVDAIGADGETREVADLLKSSDQGEIVDESYSEKLEKAERTGGEPDPEEEDAKGKKKKKKKKKNLFAKLFGKNKDDSDENDDGDNEESDELENNGAADNSGVSGDVVNIRSDVEPGVGGTTENGDVVLIPDDEPGENKPAEGDGSDKEKPKKKKGLLQKILDFLTEEVEEEVAVPEAKDTILSNENQAILEEIDAEGDDKKKKKGKKEKKPKEEKPKKEKKPKTPKPKKEKLTDPKDKAKAIPKKYIGAIVLMAVSICAILMLVASYMPALMNLSEARDAYYSKNYKEAFYTMYGKDLNESDTLMYEKARTIVLVDRKYESYENYMLLGMRLEALDALLSGIRKYEEVKDYGETLQISGELGEIKAKIIDALMNEFGVSDAQAHEIIELSPLNYSRMLDSIINGTPYVSAEDEVNAMYGLPVSSETEFENGTNDTDIIPLDQFPDLLPPEEDYLNGQNQSTDAPTEAPIEDPLPEEQPAGLDTLTEDQINTFNDDHPETEIQNPEVVIDSELF